MRSTARIGTSMVRRRIGALAAPVVAFDGRRSRVSADLRTALGLTLYRYGYWDDDLSLLGRLLRPGDVFVDAGGNVGLFTLAGAARVGPTGQVITCEPASSTARELRANLARNDYGWVCVEQVALGESPGSADLVTFPGDHSGLSSFAPADASSGVVETVPVTTLDELLTPELRARVRLVKIDVEGAEVKVLRGARGLLERERPHFLVEVEPAHLARQGASETELYGIFAGAGYRAVPTGGDSPNVWFSPQPS